MIGQTGELLGHNLFAYCKNNPINRKDDHGFRSSGVIDECGGMSDFELPSSPSFISRAADIITGVLEKITRIPEYESVKTGTFGGGPMEVRGIPSAARQAIKPYEKVAKKISWGVTAVTGLWDAAHIWTANTGLTKEQRLLRIGLKGIGIGMGMIGGALAAPFFASAIAAGATLTGAAYLLAGGAVSYGVGSLLESGESYVSRKLGLGYE